MALGICLMVQAQEFDKSVASARSAYSAGNLEDARFNLENALREVDIAIGKEVMKVLPTSLGTLPYNAKEDNVSGASSTMVGLSVHREYGKAEGPNATLDVLSDSPLLTGVNAILAMPAIMNSGNTNQKVVKIQGYKTLLTKLTDDNGATTGYDAQTPFGSSMLTVHYEGSISEADMIKLMNSVPLEKIIAIAQ
jgi:hypothetical protein